VCSLPPARPLELVLRSAIHFFTVSHWLFIKCNTDLAIDVHARRDRFARPE
jgi:hypothetical protein